MKVRIHYHIDVEKKFPKLRETLLAKKLKIDTTYHFGVDYEGEVNSYDELFDIFGKEGLTIEINFFGDIVSVYISIYETHYGLGEQVE